MSKILKCVTEYVKIINIMFQRIWQRKLEVCFDERIVLFELKLMNNYERATRVLKNLSTREVDGRFFVPNRRAYAQAVVECSTLLGLENE
ncbi:MAG: hypothetical protein ACLU2J_04420 [Clostridia bacterium]